MVILWHCFEEGRNKSKERVKNKSPTRNCCRQTSQGAHNASTRFSSGDRDMYWTVTVESLLFPYERSLQEEQTLFG